MNLAIIDDSRSKITQISALINSLAPECTIEVARSFSSGRKLILAKTFNLLVLDMTLPTFERVDGTLEGENRHFGGRQLLEEIRYYQVPSKAIIVTQFEKFGSGADIIEFKPLMSKLLTDHKDVLVGGVYFERNSSKWQETFTEMFRRCLGTKL